MKATTDPADATTHQPPANESLLQRFAKLQPYFGSRPSLWLLVALAAGVSALTEPLIPALLKPLLDQGFQQRTLAIWMVPVALMGLFAIRGLASYSAQIGLTRITNHGLLLMRQAMFNKLLHADLSLFSSQNSSALSNTVVYEVQIGAAMLVNSILNLMRNGLTLIALTAYLFYLNWQLTLIVAAIFPAIAWVMRVLTRKLHRLTKENQQATDHLAYVVEENVLAHRDIRLHAAQGVQANRFARLSQALEQLALKSTVAGAATTPLTQMLAAAALSAVISVALLQSTSSGTSVGGFVAFVAAMLMIISPIRQLSEVSSPITRSLAALERGLDLINHAEEKDTGTYSVARASGAIALHHVSVVYQPGASPALDAIDLTIQPGETVALVGPSGSGKSTLVNLLTRFVNHHSGQILLDQRDIGEWSLKSLRAQFSLVSQHIVMVNDTIAANIALGMPLDRARVQACLQAAHLASWIDELPQGIDTLVGHNAMQLSGGQRQRLAIARALYKNAPILILDEATSALDNKSERAVHATLQELMHSRTTLIIAHRLSTAMNADRIVMMEQGKILEIGRHEELMARNGAYARLYQQPAASAQAALNEAALSAI